MQDSIDNDMHPDSRSDLTVKLLALYDINRGYIDEAEKFLCAEQNAHDASSKQSISREDIDRLYSHVFVLEHIAKLLYEEFLMNRSGRQPEWTQAERRQASNHESTQC